MLGSRKTLAAAAAMLLLAAVATPAVETVNGPTRIRFVDGTPFLGRSSCNLQVWVALAGNEPLDPFPKDLRLTVVVVDATSSPVPFRPEEVSAVAIVQGVDGVERFPLKTRAPLELEERASARAEWQRAIDSMKSPGPASDRCAPNPAGASPSVDGARVLEPGSHVAGILHVERNRKAIAYVINVPFGEKLFQFKVPAPEE